MKRIKLKDNDLDKFARFVAEEFDRTRTEMASHSDLMHVKNNLEEKILDVYRIVEKVERKVDLILTEEAFKKLQVRVERIEKKLGLAA